MNQFIKNSTMDKKLLLKDQLFHKGKVQKIAREIVHIYPKFKEDEFVCLVVEKFPELELKARISWITECLKKHLPEDYYKAVSILIKSMPKECDPQLSDNDFGDFIYSPYADFVAQYGCTKDKLSISLKALKTMTTRFSAEDAIRYFLNTFPEETLLEMNEWSKNQHYHVRRLSSEGTRPKLPWSQKINIPITFPLTILDNLFSDKTRFVTRSVANHINDISKIEPDLVIHTLTRWKESGKQNIKEMNFILRHSLRTLIKHGNKKALELLGVDHEKKVKVSNFNVPAKVNIDTNLEFSFLIKAEEDAIIIADYILYFQNKSGKLNSKKIFKLKKFSMIKGDQLTILKKHLLKQFMTTRTIYPGKHEIEIQINGKIYAKKSFEVIFEQ